MGSAQFAIIRYKRVCGLRPQCLFDDGMTARCDLKGMAVIDMRSGKALRLRQLRQPGSNIDFRQSFCNLLQRLRMVQNRIAQSVEMLQLDLLRAPGGIGNLAFQFCKLGRREPHGIGHGLAMNEAVFSSL